jgi:hypothetical protein
VHGRHTTVGRRRLCHETDERESEKRKLPETCAAAGKMLNGWPTLCTSYTDNNGGRKKNGFIENPSGARAGGGLRKRSSAARTPLPVVPDYRCPFSTASARPLDMIRGSTRQIPRAYMRDGRTVSFDCNVSRATGRYAFRWAAWTSSPHSCVFDLFFFFTVANRSCANGILRFSATRRRSVVVIGKNNFYSGEGRTAVGKTRVRFSKVLTEQDPWLVVVNVFVLIRYSWLLLLAVSKTSNRFV